MPTEVERLVTPLEARISGYERELKKATNVANREARNIESTIDIDVAGIGATGLKVTLIGTVA